MRLYKNKSGNWSVQYRDERGNEHTRSLKTKNKKEAEGLVKEAKIEQLERAGAVAALTREVVSVITSGKNATIDTVFSEWVEHRRTYSASEHTIYTSEHIIKNFQIDTGITLLNEVTERDVYNYINKENGISRGAKEQQLSTLRGLFDFATKRGYIINNPTLMVKVNASLLSHKQKESKPREPFTEEEFLAIQTLANPFLRSASLISWYTGLRLGDICRLEWDSINEDSIVVWTIKRDKRVEIPFDHELIGAGRLKVLFGGMEREGQYCFPKAKAIMDNPRSRSNYSVQFGRLMKKLDLKKSFHCLRHSFVSRLKKAGMELEDIGKLVGHSDTKTTEIYSHE